MQFYDRVRAVTATTGVGPITMGPAVAGFRPFDVMNPGDVIPYLIEEGTAWEIGHGVWDANNDELSRSLIVSSTGSLISLAGAAEVSVVPAASDLAPTTSPVLAGPVVIESPDVSSSGQLDALIMNFGDTPRIRGAQQGLDDQNPLSGLLEVISPEGRIFQMSHYQYGAALRGQGPLSHVLELQLGDGDTGAEDPHPNFSVRGYTLARGAIVQARNETDTSGVRLDYTDVDRPKLTVDDNALSADEFSMEHPRSTGFLTFRVNDQEYGRISTGGASFGTLGVGVNPPTARLSVRAPDDDGLELSNGAESTLSVSLTTTAASTAQRRAVLQSYRKTVGPLPLSLQELGGNVGIGVSTPSAKLSLRAGDKDGIEISSNAESSTTLLLQTDGGGTNDRRGAIQAYRSTDGPLPLSLQESGGNVGIGVRAPTAALDIAGSSVRIRTARTPSSASAAGETGEICWDSGFIYVCIAPNSWKRAALASW